MEGIFTAVVTSLAGCVAGAGASWVALSKWRARMDVRVERLETDNDFIAEMREFRAEFKAELAHINRSILNFDEKARDRTRQLHDEIDGVKTDIAGLGERMARVEVTIEKGNA